MMDVLGHDNVDHAKLDSGEASKVRLAAQGMDRPVVDAQAGEPRGEPPHNPLINTDNGRL
jgi:hypothetical protein